MKSLVVYDSNFGNTRIIAETISKELGNSFALPVEEFRLSDLTGVSLLIIGSPINGWRPTARIIQFLTSLTPDRLRGVKAAAFDTRMETFWSGNAAKKIARALSKAGAELVADPQAFYVHGKEGPLAEGEVQAASFWAKNVNLKANNQK